MHRRPILALLLAAAVLTACSSEKPAADPPAKSSAPPIPAPKPAAPGPGDGLKLGAPALTVGEGGKGVLEMTPLTVVYIPESIGTKPEHEVFAYVVVKERPTTATSAAPVVPISGGGWSWVAPDGQAIDESNGAALTVVAGAFNAAGDIQPGTHVLDGLAFDLTKAQSGGTLMYTDGEGTAYRWKMPAQDTGPHIAQVKKELAP